MPRSSRAGGAIGRDDYTGLVYEQAMRLKREAVREATHDIASADTGGGR